MNKVSIIALKCLQHVYRNLFGNSIHELPVLTAENGNNLIYDILSADKPCMIARYGFNELSCVTNYLEIKYGEHNVWKNIRGESHDWWWNEGMMRLMNEVAGFYPTTEQNLEMFSQMMIDASSDLDALAVFPRTETGVFRMQSHIPQGTPYFHILSFDSFLFPSPWTRILKGKRVLVVHPFAELIESQYQKRDLLFDNKEVLPDFDLITLKAVQSFSGDNNRFATWFEALDWMKSEMENTDYDIALIGCGAYGFPLASHAKRTGHQAVHIGGGLQLLFGIKGRRWENPSYAKSYNLPENTYTNILSNSEWVRPSAYTPNTAEKVESACYW